MAPKGDAPEEPANGGNGCASATKLGARRKMSIVFKDAQLRDRERVDAIHYTFIPVRLTNNRNSLAKSDRHASFPNYGTGDQPLTSSKIDDAD
jgi:hypothetical protein